jgi:hypothetical protein
MLQYFWRTFVALFTSHPVYKRKDGATWGLENLFRYQVPSGTNLNTLLGTRACVRKSNRQLRVSSQPADQIRSEGKRGKEIQGVTSACESV